MTNSFLAAIAAALIGLTSFANPAEAHGGFGGGRGGGKLFASSFQIAWIARHLEMTDEQKAQLRDVLDAARPEADRLADAMVTNRDAMKEFREQENLSDAEIRAIADQQGRLVADMMVLHARVHSQIRGILTPEQFERFQQMRKKHRGKGRHRHGRATHTDPES